MEYVIANPPAGIYQGDIHAGYAFYHVLLDVHARYMSKKEDTNVVGPRFSLNVFGKRAEKVSTQQDSTQFRSEMDAYVSRWTRENRLRDCLNLSLEGTISDNDPLSVIESQKAFLQLDKLGYLIKQGNSYYLDADKISRERDLISALDSIEFYPERSKGEFRRFVLYNTKDPLAITKPTRYSASNPLGGENLGPLFVSSTLWEAYYPQGIDLLAIGEKGLLRYGMLRFLVRMATHDSPLTKKVFCFNKIDPEGGFSNWDMKSLTADSFSTDMLRYAFVKNHSLNSQKTSVKQSDLKGGRNFIYLVGNLGKFFSSYSGRRSLVEAPFNSLESDDYNPFMERFKFNEALTRLEIRLKQLSGNIQKFKDRGDLNLDPLFLEYLQLLDRAESFVPEISKISKKRILE